MNEFPNREVPIKKGLPTDESSSGNPFRFIHEPQFLLFRSEYL